MNKKKISNSSSNNNMKMKITTRCPLNVIACLLVASVRFGCLVTIADIFSFSHCFNSQCCWLCADWFWWMHVKIINAKHNRRRTEPARYILRIYIRTSIIMGFCKKPANKIQSGMNTWNEAAKLKLSRVFITDIHPSEY